MYLPCVGIFQGIISIIRPPHNKAMPCLWLELIVHDWFAYLTFFLQLFQIFNKQTVHLCMCRWRVHLPICQDPPGAQADGVRQGHPPTEREPKRQSRHTLRQWRWYQVSPADGYKNTPLKMGKQKRPKTTSQGEEKQNCGDTLFLPQPQHRVLNIKTKSKCVPTPDADLIHDKHLFALLLQAAPPCG